MSYKARPYSKWSTEAQVGASNYLGIMNAYLSKNRDFSNTAAMIYDLEKPMSLKSVGKKLTKMYTEVSGSKKSKELKDAVKHASDFISNVYSKLIESQGEDKVLPDGKTSMSDTFNWIMRLKGVHGAIMYPGTDNMNDVEIDMNNQYRQLDLDSRYIEDIAREHTIYSEYEDEDQASTAKTMEPVHANTKPLEPVHAGTAPVQETAQEAETVEPEVETETVAPKNEEQVVETPVEEAEEIIENEPVNDKPSLIRKGSAKTTAPKAEPKAVEPVQANTQPVNNVEEEVVDEEPATATPVESTTRKTGLSLMRKGNAKTVTPKPETIKPATSQAKPANNFAQANVANDAPAQKTATAKPSLIHKGNAKTVDTPKPVAPKTEQPAKNNVNYPTRNDDSKPKLYRDSMVGLGVGLYATNVRPIVYTDENNFVHSAIAMEVKKRDDLPDQKTKYDGHYVSNREGDKAPHFQGLNIASANAYFKATNQPTRTAAQIAEDFENKVTYNSGAFVGNVSKPSNAKGKDDYIFNANPKAIKPASDFATAKEPEDYKVREAREANAAQQAKQTTTSNELGIDEADLPF